MSTRGLPGFLRRSLRLTTARDDEEEEEEEEDEVDEEAHDANDDNDDHANGELKLDTTTTITPQQETSNQSTRIASQYPSDPNHESLPPQGQQLLHNNNNSSSSSMNSLQDNNLSDSWNEIIPTETTTKLSESSSLNNNNSYSIKKSYREQQYEKILSMDVIQMYELRALAWNGIPIQYRAMVWKLLLGYVPTNGARREITIQRKRHEYQEAIVQYYNENDDNDDDIYNNSTATKTMSSHHRTVQEQETLRQVLVDVPRTQPQIPLFRNQRIQQSLSRILYIWAIRHPASSYVQGINDLVTPLITVFLADYYINGTHNNISNESTFSSSSETTANDHQQQIQQLQQVLDGHVMNHCSDERLQHVEADVYWCLTNLLSSIQDHYTADQPGLQRMVGRLEELVYRIDKDLTVHIRDEIGIQFLQFSFKWMNCLLLREFHLKCIFRLWDTYLSEKDGFEDFHVYVCAAFMCQFSHQLQTMSFDELFGFMQDIPTTDWTDTEIEVLLSQAFVLSTLFKGSDAHLTNNSPSV